jgi:glyoxylase-like metal-dependent hydrolase (beta-lactamase superfamily II)
MEEFRIHTYTAAEPGLFVNSYLLESADGVVLVDAGLLVSDARALGARIAALHKPLVAPSLTGGQKAELTRVMGSYLAGQEFAGAQSA